MESGKTSPEKSRLAGKVHVALDELRMQMMGAQVLFGFQLQSTFQGAFDGASRATHLADLWALSLMVLTIGLLIAAPSQLRLVEKGQVTHRIHRVATRFAETALMPFSFALGFDFYVATNGRFGSSGALVIGVMATVVALLGWYVFGVVVKAVRPKEEFMEQPQEAPTPLHVKIDEMLTESRVVLPGAQALLGFQFVVTLTKTFASLSPGLQALHIAALAADALAIVFLIAPAALHRIAFSGEDVPQFHTLGSIVITIAMFPLSTAIACDFYLAAFRMSADATVAGIGAGVVFLLLLGLWYALPLALRQRAGKPAAAPALEAPRA